MMLCMPDKVQCCIPQATLLFLIYGLGRYAGLVGIASIVSTWLCYMLFAYMILPFLLLLLQVVINSFLFGAKRPWDVLPHIIPFEADYAMLQLVTNVFEAVPLAILTTIVYTKGLSLTQVQANAAVNIAGILQVKSATWAYLTSIGVQLCEVALSTLVTSYRLASGKASIVQLF